MVIVNTIISTKVAEQQFPEAECPFCHNKGHMRMDFFNTKTVNLALGISMPTKAGAELHCGMCRKEVPAKQWTPEQKEAADTTGRQYRNKFRIWPRWFLIAFFVLIVGAVIYQSFFHVDKFGEADKAARVAIASPQPGMVLAFAFTINDGRSARVGPGTYALVESADGKNLRVRLSSKEESDPFFYTVLNRKFDRADFAADPVPARVDQYGSLTLTNPATGKEEHCKIYNAYTNAVR